MSVTLDRSPSSPPLSETRSSVLPSCASKAYHHFVPDTVSRQTRSHIMASVRHWDTTPELLVRAALRELGLQFRVHAGDLPGRPDVVAVRHRLVLQINGCFWHGHGCRRGRLPTSNRRFWKAKIGRNRARDARTARRLRAQGWSVFTIWECRLMHSTSNALRERLGKIAALALARLSRARPSGRDAINRLSEPDRAVERPSLPRTEHRLRLEQSPAPNAAVPRSQSATGRPSSRP